MKTLAESIFGQDITQDPFESIIDRLDPEKYSPEVAYEALDQLFEIGLQKKWRYGFYSAGTKKEQFLKAIQKRDWIMLARKDNRQFNHSDMNDYAVEWIYKDTSGYLDRFQISWRGTWYADDINIGYDMGHPNGAKEVIERHQNMNYDDCILITDKKMKDALKKRLKELGK